MNSASSSGSSMSSAIAAVRITVGCKPSARAAARWGKKLSGRIAEARHRRASTQSRWSQARPGRRDGECRAACVRRQKTRDVRGRHARDIARHGQHGRPLGREPMRGSGHRTGVTVARTFGPDLRAVAERNLAGGWLDGDDDDAGKTARCGQRLEHILEHRSGEFLPQARRQQWREALFGARELLDRYDRPDIAPRTPIVCHGHACPDAEIRTDVWGFWLRPNH